MNLQIQEHTSPFVSEALRIHNSVNMTRKYYAIKYKMKSIDYKPHLHSLK